MLFNSYLFLLCFLPVTLAGFFILARRSNVLAASWLSGASVFFYGWWDYRYVPLLLASITLNYWSSLQISGSEEPARKRWLVLATASNLILLAYYKYAGFFLSNLSDLTGHPFPTLNIILPIGISFFTFTQIAFLVDTYQRKVTETRFVHYLLFVTYFPHLIAGPVLHHKEMMPQFARKSIYSPSASNFSVGFTIFFIGLAKKVLIADNLAVYANPLFMEPQSPSLIIAWGGVLAYAFQLYFDFSGYSDMAIGLSRLFGVRLPLNFNSPYKASNISEFWRCWHMTLSRFLRDYLYIPLGGGRRGKSRRYLNLMLTMLLGGLWHGAGWNFVIWGGLHGLYLVIHHAWQAFAKGMRFSLESQAWKRLATAVTFGAVCVAWVFFRSPDVGVSLDILRGMSGGFGMALPEAIGDRLGVLRPFLENTGITFYLGGASRFLENWVWIAVAATLTFFFPNTQQIIRRFEPALHFDASTEKVSGRIADILIWVPSRRWAVGIGFLALTGILSLNRPSDFLYFQF